MLSQLVQQPFLKKNDLFGDLSVCNKEYKSILRRQSLEKRLHLACCRRACR